MVQLASLILELVKMIFNKNVNTTKDVVGGLKEACKELNEAKSQEEKRNAARKIKTLVYRL